MREKQLLTGKELECCLARLKPQGFILVWSVAHLHCIAAFVCSSDIFGIWVGIGECSQALGRLHWQMVEGTCFGGHMTHLYEWGLYEEYSP